jgi:hypothetical protein
MARPVARELVSQSVLEAAQVSDWASVAAVVEA